MKLFVLLLLAASSTFLTSCVAVYGEPRVEKTYPHGKRYGDHRIQIHFPGHHQFVVDFEGTSGHAFSLTQFQARYMHSSSRAGTLAVNLLELPYTGSKAGCVLVAGPDVPKLPNTGTYELSLHYRLNGRSLSHHETVTRTLSPRVTTFDPVYLIPNAGFSRAMNP